MFFITLKLNSKGALSVSISIFWDYNFNIIMLKVGEFVLGKIIKLKKLIYRKSSKIDHMEYCCFKDSCFVLHRVKEIYVDLQISRLEITDFWD